MNLIDFLNGHSAFDMIGHWLEEFPCYFLRLPFAERNNAQGPAGFDSEAIIALSLSPPDRIELHDFPSNIPDLNPNQWWFSSFSYEAGLSLNGILPRNNNDLQQPAITSFYPDLVLSENNKEWKILFSSSDEMPIYLLNILNAAKLSQHSEPLSGLKISIMPEFNRYKSAFSEIQNHLKRGDVYELNYCVAAQGEFSSLNPALIFKKLVSKTFAPFSTLAKYGPLLLISASPERFIKSNGKEIFLQPMKGTAKRCLDDPSVDAEALSNLINSEKERAENVMIVDLSRNDLTKFAGRGVVVSELFGPRTLQNVFQLVSTIQAPLPASFSWLDLLGCLFPPGSMTGAPKISAMQIINRLESFYRGLFSGMTGFIRPGGDFDFCVVIRSVIANSELKKLILPAGSAITLMSSDELEFKECLFKMDSMIHALCTNEERLRA